MKNDLMGHELTPLIVGTLMLHAMGRFSTRLEIIGFTWSDHQGYIMWFNVGPHTHCSHWDPTKASNA